MSEQSRRRFLTWLGINGIALTALGGTAEAAANVTVFVNATLIDGTGAPAKRHTTIVLAGDRIVFVGHAKRPPEAARIVDLRGKYVIPGLWDMHAHGAADELITLPLLIANGVTSARDMWGFPATHAARDRIEAGTLLGPRLTISSNIIDGRYSLWAPQVVEVETAEQARAAVQEAQRGGADFLKIYGYLRPEALYALAAESRRLGLPFAGHVPTTMTVREVSDAGISSFEHLFGTTTATSVHEHEVMRRIRAIPIDPNNRRAHYDAARALEMDASLSHSPAKAAALWDHLARNGTWQSPTLHVLKVLSSPADTYLNDPRLKYVTPATRQLWADRIKLFAPTTPPEIARHRRFIEFRFGLVADMARAGVRVIGGTDTPNPYVFPGFSVHDELENMVTAGLSPMRALQTMTSEAACFLGKQRTQGTVTVGKVADLVVLDADPLTDIRNTQKINAVVVRGRLITAREREKILADVEKAAAGTATAREAQRYCGCH